MINTNNIPWSEKYRPECFEDIKGQGLKKLMGGVNGI